MSRLAWRWSGFSWRSSLIWEAGVSVGMCLRAMGCGMWIEVSSLLEIAGGAEWHHSEYRCPEEAAESTPDSHKDQKAVR